MKGRGWGILLSLVILIAWGNPQQIVPVAVSPGSESGVAVVAVRCPTFSWSSIPWAVGYRVTVFEATTTEAVGYEVMAAFASTMLDKEIQGPALSWTPSNRERLRNGGLYVWYVQALDASGHGVWSAGKVFEVEVEEGVGRKEERLTKVEEGARWRLRKKTLGDEPIADMPEEMKSGITAGELAEGFSMRGVVRSSGEIGIQGTEGTVNTFYGYQAGAVTTGTAETFIGAQAGRFNTTANANTFIGYQAGYTNTTGWYNCFTGAQAGYKNTTGIGNTFTGFAAGYNNTTANFNTFMGNQAGYYNTTGAYNHFNGFVAGYKNTTGYNNCYIGAQAGYSNTTGYNNAFIGMGAGYTNTTGRENTFVGYQAGNKTVGGSSNNFIGYQAGAANTSGNHNVFEGYQAGWKSTTGYWNTIVGPQAGTGNTSGYYNTFLGPMAGFKNTTGYFNTYVGPSAGWSNQTGSYNVILGNNAGYFELGSNKLYIDSIASPTSSSLPLIYGDFSTDYLVFYGNVGIQMKPTHLVDVKGGAYCNGLKWVDVSSREYKENIGNLTSEEALKALGELEPVKYNYKSDKNEQYLGFVAEDVPELVAMKDRKGLSAMDVVAVLTKVVQEQQDTIKELQKRIAKLEKER